MPAYFNKNMGSFAIETMIAKIKQSGDSVRQKKTFGANWPQPNSIYLIYIKLLNDNTWEVTHWQDDIGATESVSDAESRLVTRADSPPIQNDPMFMGRNFENIFFREKSCYFTLVMNAPGWRFHPASERPSNLFHDDCGQDPVLFVDEKINIGGYTRRYDIEKNKTFYNMERINIAGKPTYDACRCVNFLKDVDTGQPLKAKSQHFIFNIYLTAAFNVVQDSAGFVIVIDPDGTNTGPPQ